MQDPLKQGLKPAYEAGLIYDRHNSNARSTKTRIETTGLFSCLSQQESIRMQDPLKQGLKQAVIE